MSEVAFARPDERTLEVRLAGDWLLALARPSAADVARELDARPTERLRFRADGVRAWDSGLLTFLRAVLAACRARSVAVDRGGLPEGVRKLLALAEAAPEHEPRREPPPAPWIARVGAGTLATASGAADALGFLGGIVLAVERFFARRARYQARDLWLLVQECGAHALPIVALIAFLVGLILAFVGAVQLERFGAQVYVANLVGVGMVREMGALMTGILMAGRTGAAFAAQIGTMKVNEEVDALVTLGLQPLEYLVLPRVLALFLMMPFLCIFADLIGIAGGGLVGMLVLDIPLAEYSRRTVESISVTDCLVGLSKSAVFGVLVAVAGCRRGMRTAGSASAVGDAATAAVVSGIVAIVAADGIFAVLTGALGV